MPTKIKAAPDKIAIRCAIKQLIEIAVKCAYVIAVAESVNELCKDLEAQNNRSFVLHQYNKEQQELYKPVPRNKSLIII